MLLDYPAMKFLLDLIQMVITLLIGLYVWQSNRHRVTNERISELESDMDERLDKYAERITTLEVRAGAAPTHDDLKRMHKRLDIMNGELQHLSGESSAARRTLDLIHEYLMNNGGKS